MGNQTAELYDHPIYHHNQYHLDTLAIKRVNEILHRWLWNGVTGGFITGYSRIGKTEAIKYQQNEIYTRGKQLVPTYYVSIPKRDMKTIASVFKQLCLAHDLSVKSRETADDLSHRFIHYIADKSVEKRCDHAVLFVDEVQRLNPAQLNAFAEIYDRLERLDIMLMVVFIGNDSECNELIELVDSEHYAHIYGRFFTQQTSYYGLRNEKEVKYCLQQYDKLRFPINGPTYTGYFLPREVKKGWKYASLSKDIWRIFRKYQKTTKIKSWGMQYFISTINTLLIDFLPRYGVKAFEDDMIDECINLSGLIPSSVKKE